MNGLNGICGEIIKIFKKTLDNLFNLWYNIYCKLNKFKRRYRIGRRKKLYSIYAHLS
jgi:hypothetical protein